MARVHFVVPSVLNAGGGEKKLEVAAATLREALAVAVKEMGDDFARKVIEDPAAAELVPRSLVNMYVNGKNAQFSGGLDTALKDGDEVYLLPAVAGGSEELSSRDLDRYSRQVMLESIGYEGQQRLRASRVCIVGAGGLGHPIAARLVGMGVGHVRLVDRDVIELSNLHRQVLFSENDVGKVKVEAAAERLRHMNSDVIVEPMAVSINITNAAQIIKDCDVVIDALDSVNARYALNHACVEANIPLVSGAAVGVSGQALTIVPDKTACYHCVFPALDEEAMPTCSIEGVNPAVLSIVGGIEASEAARILTGKEPALAGRILHVDIDTMDFSTTRTFRADECPVCGVNRVSIREAGDIFVEELCGRNRGKRTFTLTPPTGYAFNPATFPQKAQKMRHKVQNNGALGYSIYYGDKQSVNVMADGSAIIVGAVNDDEALCIYNSILDRHQLALDAIERTLTLDSENASLHRHKANALFDLARHDEALVAIDRAISLDGRDSYLHLSRAVILSNRSSNNEALTAIEHAILLDPANDTAHSVSCSLLYVLDRHDEALAAVERAISLDPTYPLWHSQKAHVLHNLNRHDEALAAVERAISLDPTYPLWHDQKAHILHNLNRHDEAKKEEARAGDLRCGVEPATVTA